MGAAAAPATDALAARLKDPEWIVRMASAEALTAIGPKAAPASSAHGRRGSPRRERQRRACLRPGPRRDRAGREERRSGVAGDRRQTDSPRERRDRAVAVGRRRAGDPRGSRAPRRSERRTRRPPVLRVLRARRRGGDRGERSSRLSARVPIRRRLCDGFSAFCLPRRPRPRRWRFALFVLPVAFSRNGALAGVGPRSLGFRRVAVDDPGSLPLDRSRLSGDGNRKARMRARCAASSRLRAIPPGSSTS